MRVHCLFEQSGTFKNEFKKLGYEAFDYDIQNNFSETDYVIDLFAEIESAYEGGGSVFDSISKDDITMAFFPCIYFGTMSLVDFYLVRNDCEGWTFRKKIENALDRLGKRTHFHELLYKLTCIFVDRGLKLIIENPATAPNYLITGQNYPYPTIIDKDRTLRGDYYRKPTAYWFWNIKPTDGFTYQKDKGVKTILNSARSNGDGICSEERSLISPDYARNFICDFILGKPQVNTQLNLDFEGDA